MWGDVVFGWDWGGFDYYYVRVVLGDVIKMSNMVVSYVFILGWVLV